MTSYLFVFGRTPDLALHELTALVLDSSSLSPSVAVGSISQQPDEFLSRLGGTVKIAEVKRTVPEISAGVFADIFLEGRPKHRDFGISFYDLPAQAGVPPMDLLKQVKDLLVSGGVSARFVIPRHEAALSSVVVTKQQVTELIVAPAKDGGYVIGRTVAVQNFEEWNKRDYGRPVADPKAGMLPPKVARMIVNLALGYLRRAMNDKRITILDPFCGMGTILAEALLTGATVIGTDNSEKAVEGTQKNLQWLTSAYPAVDAAAWRVFTADATHISEKVAEDSIDAIVTEPFMGAVEVGERGIAFSPEKVRNIIKGLEKLYIGCLRDWHRVLRISGVIVIALPEYRVGGRTYFVKKVVDTCETLGYTCLAGPIEYSRPQAVVRRKFFIFQKK